MSRIVDDLVVDLSEISFLERVQPGSRPQLRRLVDILIDEHNNVVWVVNKLASKFGNNVAKSRLLDVKGGQVVVDPMSSTARDIFVYGIMKASIVASSEDTVVMLAMGQHDSIEGCQHVARRNSCLTPKRKPILAFNYAKRRGFLGSTAEGQGAGVANN